MVCVLAGVLSGAPAHVGWSDVNGETVPLVNGSFEDGATGSQPFPVPTGWTLYAGDGANSRLALIEPGSGSETALLIRDGDTAKEIGVLQDAEARGDVLYEAQVMARAVRRGSATGAYINIRFTPSGKYYQKSLAPAGVDEFRPISVRGVAPPDTAGITIYLYTHGAPTPELVVDDIRLAEVELAEPPVYSQLKDLHLQTDLVRDGEAQVTIVTPDRYRRQARAITAAIESVTGVRPEIVPDTDEVATVPADDGHLAHNYILLGNRSTNSMIEELYNRFYTLLDLRYPGTGGHVLRTCHNPFGDGHNIVFVGGSDSEGVTEAAQAFAGVLREADRGDGHLTIGRLMQIKRGEGLEFSHDVRDLEIWDASKGYGSVGYFGWNSLSKHAAAYYMTGDEYHAREFLRLAFPNEEARRQIAEIDGERIENKDDPLAGPYHYNAHMMILFWDLIEESPVFSDEERLRVTNAFSRQLDWRLPEGIYELRQPPVAVGTRHQQYSAISVYCLARYFARDYGEAVWQQGMVGPKMHFAALDTSTWVHGERGNLFWYPTGISPILRFMCLSGWRGPLESGTIQKLLRAQEILCTGISGDWDLGRASISYLHRAAYLTQEGRWLEYLRRTEQDLTAPRLGQSFWPGDDLRPVQPFDMVGHWSINPLPAPMYDERLSGLPFEDSFQFGSFRSAPDASGDFILIDGCNQPSRNPYHAFALLELRLKGVTVLKGYRNQLLTRVEGLVEPRIPMDATLPQSTIVGDMAICVAEVPDAAWCNWRRTLAQRVGEYALVVDELTMREGSENVAVCTSWETPGSEWDPDRNAIIGASPQRTEAEADAKQWYTILPSDGGLRHSVSEVEQIRSYGSNSVHTLDWAGAAEAGQTLRFFHLIASGRDAGDRALACLRLADNAAALSLPEPAVAIAGQFAGTETDMAIVARTHLYGRRITAAAAGLPLLEASTPIDLYWDFRSAAMSVHAPRTATLRLALEDPESLRLDGRPMLCRAAEGGLYAITVPEGDHEVTGVRVRDRSRRAARRWLNSKRAEAEVPRAQAQEPNLRHALPDVPEMPEIITQDLDGELREVITIPDGDGGQLICAAGNTRVHILSPDGSESAVAEADGEIRDIHWWQEEELLLAGCADEQLIAFNRAGERQWVFVSEMDPAVLRTGKTYHFKSWPGHAGIWGVYSANFIDGESQAIIGSACTLEFVDGSGELVHRMPQLWGDPHAFQVIEGPGGSMNLLASRRLNDTHRVGIINNKTLDPEQRGFNGVPQGHTYVGGQATMDRYHLFYEDLDGDGQREVVGDITGSWNRVSSWSRGGRALHDASFGSGPSAPERSIRDLVVADLDADGTMEVVVATSAGLVVALDHTLDRQWARSLPSAANVMAAVEQGDGQKWVICGCDDGAVVALNATGEVVRANSVDGLPAANGMAVLGSPDNPLVAIGTSTGRLCIMRPQ